MRPVFQSLSLVVFLALIAGAKHCIVERVLGGPVPPLHACPVDGDPDGHGSTCESVLPLATKTVGADGWFGIRPERLPAIVSTFFGPSLAPRPLTTSLLFFDRPTALGARGAFLMAALSVAPNAPPNIAKFSM
jgi:hypothetical protein